MGVGLSIREGTIFSPVVILGLDPRIGQSTRNAEIELPGAARDALLKAGHDGSADFGRAPKLNLAHMPS
jgi:hypothetical protein